jgi:trigger factor
MQVIEKVINDSYAEAIKRHELQPIGQPAIELKSVENEGDFIFSAVLEIYPEIKLGDFKELNIERCISKIEEKHIDDALDRLRRENVQWEDVNDEESYKSQKGDRLEIDFTMEPLADDGEKTDGKTEKGAVIILGDGNTWVEFEQPLYDLGLYTEKEYELKMPSTHTDKVLADKMVKFTVKLNKISRPILPELNDEFASQLLREKGKSIDHLKADIRSHMEKELAQVLKNRLKDEVMDRLYATYNNSIDIPKKFMERELDRQEEVWKDRQKSIAGKNGSAIPEFPREKFTNGARRNVVLGMLLNEIVSEHKLEVEPDEIRSRAEELISPRINNHQAIIKTILDSEPYCSKITSELLEEKVVDYLASQANILDKFIDYNSLLDRSLRAN